MRTGFAAAFLLSALVLSAPGLSAEAAHADERVEVRVGVLAFQGSERAAQEWDPTMAHLGRTIVGHRFTAVPLDLASLSQALADHSIDFVITNPGHYVALEAEQAVSRIATLESGSVEEPIAAVGSVVIAKAARNDLQHLADLRGQSVAAASPDAFGGFQIIWRELDDLGIAPLSELKDVRISGFPMERVAWMVRDGAADAGILRACLLEQLIAQGAVAEGEFKVVGEVLGTGMPCRRSSRLYPDWPFAKLSQTPHQLAKQVAAALLAMPSTEGKAWTAPLDYTPVHDLFRQLKIGPYAQLAEPSLEELARRHWHWLALAALLVCWWLAHVAHVEMLVRRRTADLKAANAELSRQMRERERAEELSNRHRAERDQFSRLGILGEMASNMAHELNQPLAACINYAKGMGRMLESGRADPALLAEGVTAVADQAERAAAIIQRIRGFVRRRPPQRVAIELNEVVGETLAMFQSLTVRKGLAIHLHLAAPAPRVVADKVEVQQVLLNLLQNAVDATTGDGALAGSITVRVSASDGMVKIAVRDSGAGLSAEAASHLFEPFFTTKPEGLGLGLSICRTIVESHGGHLWAAANDGRGLTMRFTLPIDQTGIPQQ